MNGYTNYGEQPQVIMEIIIEMLESIKKNGVTLEETIEQLKIAKNIVNLKGVSK